jgi:class 3 adenylate cyclase
MEGGGGPETLTILFTDVEGSTAFLTRMGDAVGNQVMAAHERLVIEQVARHDGRHIKSLGDGCLAVFASPRRAVECAVAVQRAAMSAPLRVRMG